MFDIFSGVDGVLLCYPSNLTYFSGYRNEDAVILILKDKAIYFTDERYFEEVEDLLVKRGFQIDSIKNIYEVLRSSGIKKLGVEKIISYEVAGRLKVEGKVEDLVFVDKDIAGLRSCKSDLELEYIKKAQSITDKTFGQVLGSIKEGMTEKELASVLEGLLYINGADDLAFRSIVAFGENTSKPHASRTDRKLRFGDLITLDFGARFNGYCSDMTRTIAFGKISDEERSIYELVLEAQEIAFVAATVGMKCAEVDSVARNHFKSAGLDEYFIHSLGHSVGLDIHETPCFNRKDMTVIKKGMVITNEPGLYFKNKFGVRIEDMLYFNNYQAINLTTSPKNLIIL